MLRTRTVVILVMLLLTFIAGTAEAEVKLKVAVVNPSQTISQTTPVRFDLPKGIGPGDIIDIGGFELGYDFDAETYYVYQKLTLQPGEKRILEVELKDIWLIPGEELKFLKDHSSELLKNLEETKHYKVGGTLFTKIADRLDAIGKGQSGAALSVKGKMNLYYENLHVLDEIRGDIGMLENLVLDIGGIVEERVEVPTTMAVSIEAEKKDLGPEDIVELKVKVYNPSETRKQITPVKQVLPEEISPRYILSTDGLEISYDFHKECFYVYKDAVELEPAEAKEFVVQIRDIWLIPKVELAAQRSHTNNLVLLIEDTEYFNRGKPLSDKIYLNLDQITKLQSSGAEVGEHIAHYRTNTVSLEETKKLVAQLEKLVTQSGSTPGVTIEEAERVEGGGPEVKRARGYEGIMLIAQTIFRGKAPTPATTWKIIFAILILVAIVGTSFFILWYMQTKRDEGRGTRDEGRGTRDENEKP